MKLVNILIETLKDAKSIKMRVQSGELTTYLDIVGSDKRIDNILAKSTELMNEIDSLISSFNYYYEWEIGDEW